MHVLPMPIVISAGMCRRNDPVLSVEPFYCQAAHAKSQFYFHNAGKHGKIYPLV